LLPVVALDLVECGSNWKLLMAYWLLENSLRKQKTSLHNYLEEQVSSRRNQTI
jgi:hypothetical protein